MNKETKNIRIIKTVKNIIDISAFIIIILLLVFTGHALWNSKQTYDGADGVLGIFGDIPILLLILLWAIAPSLPVLIIMDWNRKKKL